MKPRLYLESTIPSYLVAPPSRDLVVAAHQWVTKEWWRTRRDAFEICVSQFVVDDLAADDELSALQSLEELKAARDLEITDSALELTAVLVRSGILPREAARAAAHMAISAVHRCDFLMTWNCTYIANATIWKPVQEVCAQFGSACPVICTPDQLFEDSNPSHAEPS